MYWHEEAPQYIVKYKKKSREECTEGPTLKLKNIKKSILYNNM